MDLVKDHQDIVIHKMLIVDDDERGFYGKFLRTHMMQRRHQRKHEHTPSQYFLKGTNLCSQTELNTIMQKLNQRPQKDIGI